MRLTFLALAGALALFTASGSAMADTLSDQDRLARTIEEENTLVFDGFDYDAAFKLGLLLVAQAQETKAPQSVFDIRRNGQILFRVSLAGSSPDNEHWVNAKIANMERFHVSTERKKLEFKANMGAGWLKSFPNGDGNPVQFWNLSKLEAAGLVGGGFPINVKGVGYIGTIVASGGPDDTDHDLIVAAVRKFLHK